MELSTVDKNRLRFALRETIIAIGDDIASYRRMPNRPDALIEVLGEEIGELRNLITKIDNS
jgi:hypothetical protein